MQPVTAEDYRRIAKARLPHFLFEYFDGAAFDGLTHKANQTALAGIELRQAVLRDVSQIDVAGSIFGQRLASPALLGPVGLAGMAARRGEVAAALAAQHYGVPSILSTTSICPLEEVAAAAGCWFQIYIVKDRGFLREMIARAIAARCGALVLTVDLPVAGIRWRDQRSGLATAGPVGDLRRISQIVARPRWAIDVGLFGRPHHLGNIASMLRPGAGMAECVAWTAANMDAGVTWRDVEFIRSLWPGRLVIKGILEVDDARKAQRAGADAIVISNHGGRQLDGVAATAKALPAIVDALAGAMPLFVDGGVRTGLDMFRMLALGADAVLLGRAWLFALAAGGEAEVLRMLRTMEAELRVAMALTGCVSIAGIGRGSVVELR